jgi:DNA-binding SARP family transcriptional activator
LNDSGPTPSPHTENLPPESTRPGQLQLQLSALGRPRLRIFGADLEAPIELGPTKGLAIVTYLTMIPRHTASRDQLCELLWGDRPLESARPQLRQTLWLIKLQTKLDLLSASATDVTLAMPVQCDALDFTRAVVSGDLESGMSLYRGEFFSGYAAPGSQAFEEWAELERCRFRSFYVQAAESRIRDALNHGRFSDATRIAEQLRTHDPNGQSGWRMLIESRVAAGDLVGARANADQFEEWLVREGIDIDASSTAVLRSSRQPGKTNDKHDHPKDLVAELVGRAQEFSTLHTAWLGVESKGAQVIHLVGDSGLGKTRLTRDVAARIRAARGRARHIGANYGERAIPFSFAAAIVHDLAALRGAGGVAPASAQALVALDPALSTMFTVATEAARPLEPLRVGRALLDLIGAIADETSFAIILDDIHWCDAASREALTVAGSRLSSEKVLLVTTSRAGYGTAPLSDGATIIRLTPLDASGTTEMIASISRLPDHDWARQLGGQIYRIARGSPLDTLRTLRALIGAGVIDRRGEEWHCADPSRLEVAIAEHASDDRRLADLSETEVILLTILAVAGMPVPQAVVASVPPIASALASNLAAGLEIRGLLTSADQKWSLSHDTLGETLLQRMSPQDVRQAHLWLGAAMERVDDPFWRRRSVFHLAESGAWREAAEAAVPFVASSLGSSVDHDIRRLLGASATDDIVAQVKAGLPVHAQASKLRMWHAVAATIVIGIAGVAFAANRSRIPIPEVGLLTSYDTGDGAAELRYAPLLIDRWNNSSALRFRAIGTESTGTGARYHLTPRPGTNTWAAYLTYPDSGNGDVALMSAAGSEKRLTTSRSDDRPFSFSPDGRHLLILTTRWSTRGWSDLAFVNMADLSVRRLTSGGFRNEDPAWSPDGTTIAFKRQDEGWTLPTLCTVEFSGQRVRCHALPGLTLRALAGWLDPRHVLFSADSSGKESRWYAFDIHSGLFAPSQFPPNTEVELDPTGAWAVIRSGHTGLRTLRVAPSGRIDLARDVARSPDLPATTHFVVPRVPENYIDSLTIVGSDVPVPVGVPHRLLATAFSRTGKKLPLAALRWRSLTPDVGNIDSLGVISPLKEAAMIIEASAGGWRTVRDTINIVPRGTRLLLDEQWKTESLNRWRFFGQPLPRIATDGRSRAFFNNGDDDYFSGAYFADPVRSPAGLVADFEVSTPITRTQWQSVLLGLNAVASYSALKKWDHRTGYLAPFMTTATACWYVFPEGEGPSATSTSLLRDLNRITGRSSYRLDQPGWYRVRLQVFPDGRCGIAINGHALRIMESDGPWQNPVHLILQGNSVESPMLVRRVRLRAGVASDVDWTQLRFDGKYWTPL